MQVLRLTSFAQSEHRYSGTKRIFVTGTPGIGKTTFMYYFIWRFLNDTEESLDKNRFNLYIQCSPDDVLQFEKGRVKRLYEFQAKESLRYDNSRMSL